MINKFPFFNKIEKFDTFLKIDLPYPDPDKSNPHSHCKLLGFVLIIS